jgi:hypothetical protein
MKVSDLQPHELFTAQADESLDAEPHRAGAASDEPAG